MGYTTIGSRTEGIHTETTYFVPSRREPRDLAHARDQRARHHQPTLSLFSAIEWCLWDANDDATNFQRNYSIGEVEVEDGVIYHKTEYRERRNHFAWFACSEPNWPASTRSATTSWAPTAVGTAARGRGRCRARDSMAHGWQPIGSHHVRLEAGAG